jgi:hypothetical protein
MSLLQSASLQPVGDSSASFSRHRDRLDPVRTHILLANSARVASAVPGRRRRRPQCCGRPAGDVTVLHGNDRIDVRIERHPVEHLVERRQFDDVGRRASVRHGDRHSPAILRGDDGGHVGVVHTRSQSSVRRHIIDGQLLLAVLRHDVLLRQSAPLRSPTRPEHQEVESLRAVAVDDHNRCNDHQDYVGLFAGSPSRRLSTGLRSAVVKLVIAGDDTPISDARRQRWQWRRGAGGSLSKRIGAQGCHYARHHHGRFSVLLGTVLHD